MDNDDGNDLNQGNHNLNEEHDKDCSPDIRLDEVRGDDASDGLLVEENHENQNRNDEETRLDAELQIVRNLRVSFVSTLKMLEVARDDLINSSISHDIDELHSASQRIRAALAQLRDQIQ